MDDEILENTIMTQVDGTQADSILMILDGVFPGDNTAWKIGDLVVELILNFCIE